LGICFQGKEAKINKNVLKFKGKKIQIDDTPEGISITSKTNFVPNISKWLLWEGKP
jgi:hypothetical protein